jgi:hypothetical protein
MHGTVLAIDRPTMRDRTFRQMGVPQYNYRVVLDNSHQEYYNFETDAYLGENLGTRCQLFPFRLQLAPAAPEHGFKLSDKIIPNPWFPDGPKASFYKGGKVTK